MWMAAFIDEGWKQSPCQYIGLAWIHWKCCIDCSHSPTSFPKFERSSPCIDGFVYSMFLNSGEHAANFIVPGECFFTLHLGLILLPQFPSGLENLLLSTHLRIFDFWLRIALLPVSWCLAWFFFFHRHSPDWLEIPNLMRKFPRCAGCASPDSQVLLLLSVSHRSRLLPVLVSTWHQSQCALYPLERKLLK